MIYNELGVDSSLTVVYNDKFHDQNKKTTAYCLLICWFLFTSVTDVMSILEGSCDFFLLFLLAAAKSVFGRRTKRSTAGFCWPAELGWVF